MTFYKIVELLASLIESVLIISAVTQISGKKFNGAKHLLWIWGISIAFTGIVTYLNSYTAFSFITIAVGGTFAICATKITSKAKFLLRTLACILTLFFLHTLDYIIGFSSAILVGGAQDIYHGWELMMRPGTTRTVFTVVNKSLQIFAFFGLKPLYGKLRLLNKRYQCILLAITISCYIVMSILLSLIMEESLIVMQIAIIFSWLFIMLCLIAFIVVSVLSTRHQQGKQKNEMIMLSNKLMEKNYSQLYINQKIISKQAHDFTNHMKVLSEMVQENSDAEKYLQNLLTIPQKQAKLCNSGNSVIDAIVNCKTAEAAELEIPFSSKINLPEELHIDPIDICAILSNQIDNALEACLKINNEKERSVKIVLWQKESFLFFRVTNSVFDNPFTEGNQLASTKKGSGHGLGIENIRNTVEKYDGYLENRFSANQFISIAMVQNTVRHK